MPTVILLTLLSTTPSITHDAVHDPCAPSITLPGAPLACYREAMQRTTMQLQQTLRRLQRQLNKHGQDLLALRHFW